MTRAKTINTPISSPGAQPGQSPASQPLGLVALRRQVALLEKLPAADLGSHRGPRVLDWGLAAIDRHLPGGGLAWGALHEFAGDGPDLEEASLPAAAVARLIGRRLRLSPANRNEGGSVLWVARRRDLYARALPAAGFDPRHLLHLNVRRNTDALWAIEEALRCQHPGAAGLIAVVGEIGALDLTQSRRLQLAAEKSGVPTLLIRRDSRGGEMRRLVQQPSAAMTRWRIAAAPSTGMAAPPHPILPGPLRWRLDLWRCRGGRPATWLIEEQADGWREAAFSQPVPAPLGDRLPAPPAASADGLRPKRATG
ncbi:ImuA family protein [Dongia sp.]|uniref:ImuA family protein n=1 Tax=Dongia sp. TaxID=1977262 RepID=UPI0035B1442F